MWPLLWKDLLIELRTRETFASLLLLSILILLVLSFAFDPTSDIREAAAPGVFFFYTRLQSPRDVTVQHRWLMNGRLVRSVNLRVGANPGAGYRTYSRNTVSTERRGDWTIELRDAGGALLHEERFTVQ